MDDITGEVVKAIEKAVKPYGGSVESIESNDYNSHTGKIEFDRIRVEILFSDKKKRNGKK